MKFILETNRLRLRRFEPEDAVRLFEIHRDEAVKRWMPAESYRNPKEAEGAVRFYADRVDRQELPFVLGAVLRESGKLIGDVGLNEVEGKPGEVEIGFVIAREERGKGYAAELLRAMAECAEALFRVRMLCGRVMKGNAASARVLEKSGYRFVREETGADDDPNGSGMLVFEKPLRQG